MLSLDLSVCARSIFAFSMRTCMISALGVRPRYCWNRRSKTLRESPTSSATLRDVDARTGEIANELHRLDHVGVLDDHDLGRLADGDVAGRRVNHAGRLLARHLPVQAVPPLRSRSAGRSRSKLDKRRPNGFANHRIVADADNAHFLRHGDLEFPAGVQQTNRVHIAGGVNADRPRQSREAIRSVAAVDVRARWERPDREFAAGIYFRHS